MNTEMWLYPLLLSAAFSCCSAEPAGPPLLYLNSVQLVNQSDVVLNASSTFNLSCHGDAAVRLSSNSFLRLPHSRRLVVKTSQPRHTGTYRCGYTNQSLEHLHTWVHLYVTDRSDPASVFVSSTRDVLSVEEGEDVLVKCLLTDPAVTNLTLQSEGWGRSLPPFMNVTFDPRRGALIHNPKTAFNGRYVCSGLKDGQTVTSRPVVQLLVVARRQLHPPSASIHQGELYRIVGESFEVTCMSSNPSHLYTLTWTHPHTQKLNTTVSRRYADSRLYINSTVSVSAVSHAHAGLYTCQAINDVGVSMATTRLHVLDQAHLKISLQRRHTWTRPANASSPPPQLDDDVTGGSLGANLSTVGASSARISRSNKEEAYEGQDVTLTFVMESYPPIRTQSWTLPEHVTSEDAALHHETYATDGYRSVASLLLHRVRPEDRGRYSFHFSSSAFNGSQDVDLRIYRSPSVSISLENDTLSCRSSGYPPPAISWFSCPGAQQTCANFSTSPLSEAPVTSQEEEEVRTRLLVSLDDDVTAECVASNSVGASRAVFTPRAARPPVGLTPPLVGLLATSVFLLLLLFVILYKCQQKPRYEIRWKIIESSSGNSYTFIDPAQLPYNHRWEFPRDKLRLGAVLGSGAFGKVVEATAYGLGAGEVTRVAVKMLKPSAHSEEREALMSELKILSHLGYHDNIVNLLGACTQGGPMLMITEYCCHGDLLNFLRTHAHNFVTSAFRMDESEDTVFYKNMAALHPRLRSDSGISCCSEYQDVKPGGSGEPTRFGEQTDGLSVGDLMWFSYQVAQGLDFLSSRNCIHRDVAARNVLLTDSCVAKICDFGLARDIRNDDSYIVQGNARLPVKWMSPESIFQCVYTVQSDVWSYGVLLWEIFSLGKSPYPNVAVDVHFYKMIKEGQHMEQPDYCPAQMYHLMTLCWILEPTHRPTFKMIAQLIKGLLPSTNEMGPQNGDQTAYRNIDECREEEEEEEEEEVQEEERLKREEQARHDDSIDGEEDQMMKNIYQRS